MVLNGISNFRDNRAPLEWRDVSEPVPAEKEILLKVSACGVCHTELEEIEGRTPPPRYPMIPGHQVIGHVAAMGSKSGRFKTGDRLGVGWIFSACGSCAFCREGRENLCDQFRATGRDAPGGYSEFMTIDEDFAYPIPEVFADEEAAPLLCAGAIGYRSLRLAGIMDGQNLGLTGFGASAHLVLKMVRHRMVGVKIFVFARSETERSFARELGAVWVGNTDETAPEKLHAVIDTTPVWKPVTEALKNLEKGGRLVINAIRKEAVDRQVLLDLDYPTQLWLEKEIKSVANVTRRDISEFIQLAAEIPIRPQVRLYPMSEANHALVELKEGKIRGAKVLMI